MKKKIDKKNIFLIFLAIKWYNKTNKTKILYICRLLKLNCKKTTTTKKNTNLKNKKLIIKRKIKLKKKH